jgi:hypothetical protein
MVDIEERADITTDGSNKEDVGVFEWVVSAEQARSTDEREQIVLWTTHDALRDAFGHHLSCVTFHLLLRIGSRWRWCRRG